MASRAERPAAPTKKDQVAIDLMRSHFDVEPHMTEIWRIEGDNEASATEPIKLLEVNAATVTTDSVMPFEFAPTQGVPYPTVIAEVTPEEFQLITNESKALPKGWSLRRARKFTRHDVNGR
jgi:hypothetical protein